MMQKTHIKLLIACFFLFCLTGCEALRQSKVHPPATAETVDRRQARDRGDNSGN